MQTLTGERMKTKLGHYVHFHVSQITFQTTNKQGTAKLIDKKLHQYFRRGFVWLNRGALCVQCALLDSTTLAPCARRRVLELPQNVITHSGVRGLSLWGLGTFTEWVTNCFPERADLNGYLLPFDSQREQRTSAGTTFTHKANDTPRSTMLTDNNKTLRNPDNHVTE